MQRKMIALFAMLGMIATLMATGGVGTSSAQTGDFDEDREFKSGAVIGQQLAELIDEKPASAVYNVVVVTEPGKASKVAGNHGNFNAVSMGKRTVTMTVPLGAINGLVNNPNVVLINENYQIVDPFENPRIVHQHEVIQPPTEVNGGFQDGVPPNTVDNGYDHMDIDDMISSGYDGTGTIVAVLDDGIDPNHVEFNKSSAGDRVYDQACFTGYVDVTDCPNGSHQDTTSTNAAVHEVYGGVTEDHGTMVSSTVVGQNVGVAPDAKVLAFRIGFVCDTTWFNAGECSTVGSYVLPLAAQLAALDHVNTELGNGTNIVASNQSFGGGCYEHIDVSADHTPYFQDMIEEGAIPVSSAGNSHGGTNACYEKLAQPAAGSMSMAIAAVGALNLEPTWFTQISQKVNAWAPGEYLTAACVSGFDYEPPHPERDCFGSNNQKYQETWGGTSASAPVISGVVAQIREKVGTDESATAIKNAITTSGTSITDDSSRWSQPTTNITRNLPSSLSASNNILDINPPASSAGEFVSVDPVRIVDTRYAIGHGGGELGAEGDGDDNRYDIPIADALGVSWDDTPYPLAIVANVTIENAENPGASSYLTYWTGGVTEPSISQNQLPGRTAGTSTNLTMLDPMLGILSNGVTGYTSFRAAGDPFHMWIDVVGYFHNDSDYEYVNCREFDSRPLSGTWPLTAGSNTNIDIDDNATCGQPMGAGDTAVVSLTSVNVSNGGWWTVRPVGSGANVSQLNPVASETEANLAFVETNSNGNINVKFSGSGSSDLIVDVLGYFPDNSDTYDPKTPTRKYDSRYNTALSGESPGVINPASNPDREYPDGAESGCKAHVYNGTVMEQDESTGWSKAWRAALSEPSVSFWNSQYKDIMPNAYVAKTYTGWSRGEFKTFGAGKVHFFTDLFGCFANAD